jgi:flagellar hook-associated protein 1 FlgK
LGLNAFFSGADASDIAVRPDLLSNPRQFAGSLTGQPGDGANVSKLAALRNAPLLAGGAQTLQQSFDNLVGNVASGVQDATQQQSAQKAIGQSLQTQQQSVSGVDPNEELVKLVQSQQAYQLAAHYISVLDQTVASLLAIT